MEQVSIGSKSKVYSDQKGILYMSISPGDEMSKNKILLIVFSIFLILNSVPSAQSAEGTIKLEKVLHKDFFDLRNNKNAKNLYMILFLARKPNIPKASLGHAYVATLEFREDINSFVSTGVFGMYPDTDIKAWRLGAGKLNIKPEDSDPDHVIYVWVNKNQYQKAVSIREKWEKRGTWKPLKGDCATLMLEIAKSIGLKVPDRKSYDLKCNGSYGNCYVEKKIIWLPITLIKMVAKLNQEKEK